MLTFIIKFNHRGEITVISALNDESNITEFKIVVVVDLFCS